MSKIGEKWVDLYHDDDTDHVSVHYKPASAESVKLVLQADTDDYDGRSEFLWITLPNGDVILGTLPQGHIYELTENDHHS